MVLPRNGLVTAFFNLLTHLLGLAQLPSLRWDVSRQMLLLLGVERLRFGPAWWGRLKRVSRLSPYKGVLCGVCFLVFLRVCVVFYVFCLFVLGFFSTS